MPVRPNLFGNPGVKVGAVHGQKTLNDANSSATGSSIIVHGSRGSRKFNLNCTVDMPHMQRIKQKHNLDDRFQYMKRYVRFTRTEDLERKRMTKVSQSLVNGAFKTIDINKQYGADTCDKPLEVQVPASDLPSTVNASDFMFGVSTTLKRFMDPETTPINEWIYWLTDGRGHSNGGKLLLMLMGRATTNFRRSSIFSRTLASIWTYTTLTHR